MQKVLPTLILALIIPVTMGVSFANAQPEGEISSVEADIKVLYKEGVTLYKAGKFQEAKDKFKSILDINPLYEPARSKLRLILDTQTRMMRRDKIIAGRERILEVQKKWVPPPEKPKPMEEKPRIVRFKTEQQRIMEEKAKQIIP